MSARLTVVLDDERLYRDLKVYAASNGVPVKTVIESALRVYLSSPSKAEAEPEIKWDWDAYDQWQREAEELDGEIGPDAPTDLSDIKHHLYGAPRKRGFRLLAEEPTPYQSP
jgi:hypothetical protein